MKLYWSSRSPFVRKVMIAAHELHLTEQLTCVRTLVHPNTPNELLMEDNPLSKLPTLVLNDGTPVYDSRVICEYFDSLRGGGVLFPVAYPTRLEALRGQALGDGLMDLALVWLLERAKPEGLRSSELIAACRKKTARVLDRLEADLETMSGRPFDIGHLAIGTALLYLDFRFGEERWRDGHPHLTAWHQSFAERPSVIANPAVDQ
jgi:glutathione S-transferase